MFQKNDLLAWCITAALWMTQAGAARGQTGRFESGAKLHRLLKQPLAGTLVFDDGSVEFRSPKASYRWAYSEIKTFNLTGSRELLITGYENRRWHEPGERQFRFTLTQPIPGPVAAAFAARVARPAINGDPPSGVPSIAEMPAHRREKFGGSNGQLRFREGGIDYVTPNGRDARSWRWSDIQTIASPDPWEFRVTAYREIVEFDLKRPLSPDLFDRIWDRLYAAGLNLAPERNGDRR